MTGRLIAVEGGEGSGKTTQARMLADALGAVFTREPGGTPLGEQIRDLLLGTEGDAPCDRAEALLMAAARAQHVDRVVVPALARGDDVVTDRYIGSSLAYQGVDVASASQRSLPCRSSPSMASKPTSSCCSMSIPLKQWRGWMGPSTGSNRRETSYHARVAAAYRDLAAADPQHWVVVDGRGTVDEVAQCLQAAVAERLP